jgi:hypothetical protein
MYQLLRRRFPQNHWDIWSRYLNALLGGFIIASRKKIANRINKVIVLRQQLVYSLLRLVIFACGNNIANRINGGIVSFCIKFAVLSTSLTLYIIVFSDVILQMIKKYSSETSSFLSKATICQRSNIWHHHCIFCHHC